MNRILFHFHKNDTTHTRAKVAPPRLNGLRTGVFATRSPHRPCPIGLSLVKIDRIMENTIYFSGVDMVDQTPVLDIKPYIPQYDSPSMNVSFDDTISDVSHVSDNSPQSTDSLMNVSSLANLSLNQSNSNVRVMDGEENDDRQQAVIGATSVVRSNVNVNLEDTYHEPRYCNLINAV